MLQKLLPFAAASVLALMPAAGYLASCLNPATVPKAAINGFSILVAVFTAAAVIKRGEDEGMAKIAARARWVSLGMLMTAAIIMPKMMWAVRLGRSGLMTLAVERARLEKAGRILKPEELGPLPELRIWVADEYDREHWHPATATLAVVPPGGAIPDTGGWAYETATGRLRLACAGFEPKLRRQRLSEL